MNPNPTPKVLSILRRHGVRALLMGGQACIEYGGAEFSRDVDIAVAATDDNLERLRAALRDLKAKQIFFPALSREALERGHACHFRCSVPGTPNVRLDVMSVMRNADPFPELWRRRVQRRMEGVGTFGLVSRRDLVRIKKTQRLKDWPMIQRVVDAHVLETLRPSADVVLFWLEECRSPGLLIAVVSRFPTAARRIARQRKAVKAALAGDMAAIRRELELERLREQELDRAYWESLRRELEQMRLGRKPRA